MPGTVAGVYSVLLISTILIKNKGEGGSALLMLSVSGMSGQALFQQAAHSLVFCDRSIPLRRRLYPTGA